MKFTIGENPEASGGGDTPAVTKYTATFVDAEGNELAKESYEAGAQVVAPEVTEAAEVQTTARAEETKKEKLPKQAETVKEEVKTEEAAPAADLGRSFPVETIEERSQESACQSAPCRILRQMRECGFKIALPQAAVEGFGCILRYRQPPAAVGDFIPYGDPGAEKDGLGCPVDGTDGNPRGIQGEQRLLKLLYLI